MNSKILNDLIAKYNIKEPDLFLMLVKKALLGEIKESEVGYNMHLSLGLALNSAVELAVQIQFLTDKEKGQMLKDLDQDLKQKVDINVEVSAILSQNNLFLPEDLNNRLIKLISSYLQDIRDEMEFKDALIRSAKVGGIGLSLPEAESLLNSLKAKKAEWQKAGINLKAPVMAGQVQESNIDVAAKVVAPQIVPVAPREVTIDQILAQRAQATGRPSQMPAAPKAPAPVPVPQTTPFVEEIEQEEKFLESTEELPSPQAPVQPEAAQPMAPASIRPPEIRQPLIRPTEQTSNRPQMSDVKFDPQLFGPIDELAAMSLNDFRRLSKDPNQSIQKIRGKLDILEGESIMRRNEGVKALKSSPLYKIYADIMNQALVEGKSFEQAITGRGDINLAEFKAIMELNKSLKY